MPQPKPYSRQEQLILAILKRTRQPITTLGMAAKVYKTNTGVWNQRQSILISINSLSRKMDHNKDPAGKIVRSKGRGPYPSEFVLKLRKEKNKGKATRYFGS